MELENYQLATSNKKKASWGKIITEAQTMQEMAAG